MCSENTDKASSTVVEVMVRCRALRIVVPSAESGTALSGCRAAAAASSSAPVCKSYNKGVVPFGSKHARDMYNSWGALWLCVLLRNELLEFFLVLHGGVHCDVLNNNPSDDICQARRRAYGGNHRSWPGQSIDVVRVRASRGS